MRLIRYFVPLAIMFAAVLQILPGPKPSNPPVTAKQTLAANVRISPRAESVLRRACMNCHSNETRWPVYSHVAPFSWVVARDVERARKVMNFSEWSIQAGKRPGMAASFLAASCSDMQIGRMPSRMYLLAHPEAKLTREDINEFCGWTREEITRLLRKPAASPQTMQHNAGD